MKIYEIGTGYTSIPAQMGAATEIVVEELTKSFLNLGENVSLIDIEDANRKENQLPIIEVKMPSGFKGTDTALGLKHKLKRVVYSIALAQTLKKLIRNSKDQILLHFHNQYNLFFFLMLVSKRFRKNVKIAYTVHSYIWHSSWSEISKTIFKRYFQEVICVKKSDMVFVLNKQTQKNLIENIKVFSKNVILIDNGVNIDKYYPIDECEQKQIKQQYGVNHSVVFLQVGSVCERKNQLEAIALLAPFMKKNTNIAYVYAGGIISEDYQNQITEFAKRNGIQDSIYYLGEIAPGNQLNDIYNMSEALIFPSKSEGFSLVILEAMASGLPVIVRNDLEFHLSKECLKYLGEGQFNDIVKSEILDKKRRNETAKYMRIVIEEKYSWDRIAKDYYDNFI